MKRSRFKADVYTQGKFGKGYRQTLDTDNPFLYSHGIWPTKITADMLPDDYIKIHSRVIWYMTGYLRTSGITDMVYKWTRVNHLFKDDYLYISYGGKISKSMNEWGRTDVTDYDVCICGNDIIPIILAAEKYSGYDSTALRAGIEEKRVYLRDHQPDYYKQYFGDEGPDFDLFEYWQRFE